MFKMTEMEVRVRNAVYKEFAEELNNRKNV